MNIPLVNNVTASSINSPTATSRQVPSDATENKRAAATQQTSPMAQEERASRQQLVEAADAVNDFIKITNNSLQFSVDSDTGISFIKVIDTSTDEVIRQIPSEEMLAIAKALDSLKGLLVHQKV